MHHFPPLGDSLAVDARILAKEMIDSGAGAMRTAMSTYAPGAKHLREVSGVTCRGILRAPTVKQLRNGRRRDLEGPASQESSCAERQ